jgi:hypothetical protein
VARRAGEHALRDRVLERRSARRGRHQQQRCNRTGRREPRHRPPRERAVAGAQRAIGAGVVGVSPAYSFSRAPRPGRLPTFGDIMSKLIAAACLSLFVTGAFAAGPTCTDRADEKKLHGAARTSFVKKCEKDNAGACETMAGEKKLHGAAKNSFVKKCMKDAPAKAN